MKPYRTSIAVDSQDRVHISYDGSKYITNVTGSWVSEVVYSAIWGECCSSIALDSQDTVHISY